MPPALPMPHTAAAVRAAAELVQQAWIAAAEAAPMPERLRGAYLGGLTTPQSLVHPLGGNPLQATVVNIAPEARWVELGRPAVHLPTVINWARSRAARRSKTGRYFLIIPFMHAAARSRSQVGQIRAAARRTMMPWAVYHRARRLQPGERLPSGTPGMQPYVPRYARNIRPGYQHAERQAGMIRTPGTGRGSTYLTFRTLTQDSPGWWLPPQPGIHLAPQVEQATSAQVQALLAEGIRRDVETALQGGR
jgi:hypothetical protein